MERVLTKNTTSNIKAILKELVVNSEHDEKAKQILQNLRR